MLAYRGDPLIPKHLAGLARRNRCASAIDLSLDGGLTAGEMAATWPAWPILAIHATKSAWHRELTLAHLADFPRVRSTWDPAPLAIALALATLPRPILVYLDADAGDPRPARRLADLAAALDALTPAAGEVLIAIAGIPPCVDVARNAKEKPDFPGQDERKCCAPLKCCAPPADLAGHLARLFPAGLATHRSARGRPAAYFYHAPPAAWPAAAGFPGIAPEQLALLETRD
jgi:hypothetical protein